MNAEALGGRISERRKAGNLTQEELAEKPHVSRSAVSKWERGLSLPGIDLLEPLAEALGMTIHELIADDWDENGEHEDVIKEVIDMASQESRKRNHRMIFAILAILLCATIAGKLFSWLKYIWDIAAILLIFVCGYLAWQISFSRRKRGLVWIIMALCAGMILFLMSEIYDRDREPVLSNRTASYFTKTDVNTGYFTLNLMPNTEHSGTTGIHNEYMFLDCPLWSMTEEGEIQYTSRLSEYGMIYGTYRILAENTIQLDCEIL